MKLNHHTVLNSRGGRICSHNMLVAFRIIYIFIDKVRDLLDHWLTRITTFPTWACDSKYANACAASSNSKTLSITGFVVLIFAVIKRFISRNLWQAVVKWNNPSQLTTY